MTEMWLTEVASFDARWRESSGERCYVRSTRLFILSGPVQKNAL